MDEDQKLVCAILEGDMQAFESLVDKFQNLVFHIAGKVLKVQEDREDVCQEVFIKVFEGLEDFRFKARLSTWIARIAYFTAVDRAKILDRRKDFKIPESTVASERLFLQLEEKEQARLVQDWLKTMPQNYAVTLTLFHLEGFSCPEIAQIMGMSEGTVKSNLFRGRRELKELVEKSKLLQ